VNSGVFGDNTDSTYEVDSLTVLRGLVEIVVIRSSQLTMVDEDRREIDRAAVVD